MFKPLQTSIAAFALVAGGIGLAQAQVQTQTQGAYVGGSLGTPDYHGGINGIGDGSHGGGVAGKAFGGYQVNPYFAVEGGGFSLGHLTDGVGGKVNLRGVYVDAVGTLPIAPQWSLLGRGGVAEGRFTSTNGDDHSAGLKLGLGVQYDLSRQVALRAEYERYHFVDAFDDKPNVGMFSVGLKYAF